MSAGPNSQPQPSPEMVNNTGARKASRIGSVATSLITNKFERDKVFTEKVA